MIKLIITYASNHGVEFMKYLIASAVALAVDYGCYWTLAQSGILSLPQAAIVGYTVGLIVAYFLISYKVFNNSWLQYKKRYEVLLFLASGLLGIALTYTTVALFVLGFGERVNQAKLLAIAVSFTGVYFFRKYFVFKRAECRAERTPKK